MNPIPSFLRNWILLRKLKRTKKRLSRLSNRNESVFESAIQAENAAINNQIDLQLSKIPATELKRYHSGARLQPVSHLSIKKLNEMSQLQLESISGIGASSAYLIKKCTNDYVKEVVDNTRLRISLQSPSVYESNLVKRLYQVEKLNEITAEGRMLTESISKKTDEKKAKRSARPILWLFSNRAEKDDAIRKINEIEALLQSPLITEVEKQEQRKSQVLKAEHDAYWNEFKEDPARFYSILENINAKKSGRAVAKKNYANLDHFYPMLQQQIDSVEVSTIGLKCILRPYQLVGVKYILHQGNVLLGDEMGLGKTIEAIATMVSLRNSGETHFVVVCPASVLINWEREIKKHSDLNCYLLHGKDFFELNSRWESNGGVAITNYESTGNFKCIIPVAMTTVDEAHYIKNPYAERTDNTISILNKSKRRLLMSGTPLENKLDEMVSLIRLLQPSCVEAIRKLPQPIAKQDYMRAIAPVYFRRTKDTVWNEMPDLQVIDEVLELTPDERDLYIKNLIKKSMSGFSEMRQISFKVEDERHSSKLLRLKEICKEAFENGRKVIIFSFYLDTISRIKNCLGNSVFGPITGSLSPSKRQECIDAFSQTEGGAVLLSQIIAGGTGLNIQKASVVIICEPQYKPSTENQAVARSYRIGQTENVTVYRLLCSKTVDERILQILKEKQEIFDNYADKSISGEDSLHISETELANAEFEQSQVV